jgi:hypothetical protein
MEIDGVPESSITFLSNIKENIAHYKPIGAEGLLLNALSRAESIRLRGKILSWAKIHEDIYAFALQAKFFFLPTGPLALWVSQPALSSRG